MNQIYIFQEDEDNNNNNLKILETQQKHIPSKLFNGIHHAKQKINVYSFEQKNNQENDYDLDKTHKKKEYHQEQQIQQQSNTDENYYYKEEQIKGEKNNFQNKIQSPEHFTLDKNHNQINQKNLNKTININNIRDFLKKPLEKGVVLTLNIKKQKNGFLNMYPRFNVILELANNKQKLIMVAKKLAAKINSEYIISTNRKNITMRDKGYIGKIKSNFTGTQWVMLDQGINNDQNNDISIVRKQLAYIKYETNILGMNGPRVMQAIIPKVDDNYKTDQFKYFNFNNNMLKNKLENQQWKSIIKLKNKAPEYDAKQQVYILDFKGKIKEPSVKNFILIDQQFQRQKIIFGKMNQDNFLMEIKFPLSPLQAFGICLSSIDKKILVE